MKSLGRFFRRALQILTASALLTQMSIAAGLLSPISANLPELQIRSHQVEVTIQDGYAVTEVDQVFYNPHQQDLDALYAFPIPEKAAVSEFTIWIDGQPVTGEVLEKEEARKVHEEEKAAGRETGLAEQNSYRRFEVAVSPVRAGQDTRIRLQYIQPAHIDTGIGRYVYPLEEGGTDEDKLAFWTGNEVVSDHFRFQLNLRSAVPVDMLRLPGISDAMVTQASDGEWTVIIDRSGSAAVQASLEEIQPASATQTQAALAQTAPEQAMQQNNATGYASMLDQDIVVYWRHAANQPGSLDLITYREQQDGQGTFMLVVTPGDDLAPIQEGRDWVFVLDVSGSMESKYSTLAEGVQRAFKKMQAGDRFRIVLFNNSARELTPGWTAISPENVLRYSQQLDAVKPGDGTNLFAGLKDGLRMVEKDRTTGLILVTDGVANVGETQKRNFVKLLKGHDVRVFTFIMGNESNRPLLNAISKVSNGFAMNISNSDDIVGKLLEATQKINHQALHGVKLKLGGVRTRDVTPESHGTVYRGEQIILFGHYWKPGELSVTLHGKVSGQEKEYKARFELPALSNDNPEIERLWAFASIEALQEESDLYGEDPDRKQAMVDLAVEHGLVTEHTSMVVMREEQFAARGIARKNMQRLQTESAAQARRAAQPVAQRRADQQQPMFTGSRASHSNGGGSLDIWWLMIFVPLLLALSRKSGKRAEQ